MTNPTHNGRNANREHDNAIFRALRRADPASQLAPLDREQRNHLLEDTMTEHNTTTETEAAQAVGTDGPVTATARNRRRNALIGVAAAVAIAAGGVTWAANSGNNAPAQRPTSLSLAAGNPAADCVALTPELVGQASVAFEGTVTSIQDGVVTLQNSHTFKGNVAPTVTVAQGTGSVVDGAPVTFTAGTTYLIAAGADGVVGGCGPSGPTSPELQNLFHQAFGD